MEIALSFGLIEPATLSALSLKLELLRLESLVLALMKEIVKMLSTTL